MQINFVIHRYDKKPHFNGLDWKKSQQIWFFNKNKSGVLADSLFSGIVSILDHKSCQFSTLKRISFCFYRFYL